jgi:zinc protease
MFVSQLHLNIRALLLIAGLACSLGANATPKIESWTSQQGARVLYVYAPQLPMLDVQVVFDAGAVRDADKPGVAMLTHDVLNEGAGGETPKQIAERFETVGAQFSAEVNQEMASYAVRMLAEPDSIRSALSGLNLMLTKPDFTEVALKRQKGMMLASIQQKRQDPGDRANRALLEAVFGAHPYAKPLEGDEQSLQHLGRADVQKFFKRYYVAKNAWVLMVGAVDRASAKTWVEHLLKGVSAGDAAPAIAVPQALPAGRDVVVAHQSSQTHIHFGQVGVARTDPNFWPLYVGNHILGGNGLVSRLSEDVREKRGLAYSAASYFGPMRGAGVFVMVAQTRNAKAKEAKQVMRETLERFVKEGPTQEELEAAKKNLTGGFPLRVDDNRSIMEYLALIGFYGLPLDYLDNWSKRVENVTHEHIVSAFQRHIDPAKMVVVTLGGSE